MTMRNRNTRALALVSFALLAASGTPSSAHAQTRLNPTARRAFLSALSQVNLCEKAVRTVTADMQTVSDNLSAGSFDTGDLDPDSIYSASTCFAAAAAVHRVHLGYWAGSTARRFQNEAYAGLLDIARGEQQAHYLAIAIQNQDSSGVDNAATLGLRYLHAGTAHLNIATSLL